MLRAFRQPSGTRMHAECPRERQTLGLAMEGAGRGGETVACRGEPFWLLCQAMAGSSTSLRRLALECSTNKCFIGVGTYFVV